MDKSEIIAFRESERISTFMTLAVSLGQMTETERSAVNRAGHAIHQQAGYIDKDGDLESDGEEETAAVERHANRQRKQKLGELHPELSDELERHIEHREFHPLPEVPPQLTSPGRALGQYRGILRFIQDRRDDDSLSHDEAHAVYKPAIRVFEDSGTYMGELSERTDQALLVQASRLMSKRLLELRPEFGDALRNLGSSRAR